MTGEEEGDLTNEGKFVLMTSLFVEQPQLHRTAN